MQIFFSVIKALLLREIQTRFGSQKLGYIWMVVEPMIMILLFSALHSRFGSKTSYSVPVFIAISFLSYNLFRAILSQSMNAFKANKGLFVYKQVKPFDALVSRFVLEFFIQFLVTFVLIIIGLYLNIDIEVKDLLLVLFGVFWFAFFGFSLGILFAFFSYFFENFQKIMNILLYPLLFLSGLFYTADSLPEKIRNILLYNPVFQFEEMIHGYFFYSLSDKYVNYQYIFLWTIIPLFIGLWLYKKSERKIIMS